MSDKSDDKRQDIIKGVLTYIKQHASYANVKLLQTFAKRYYLAAAIEDLIDRSIPDLYAIVESHFKLVYQRAPHETKVRVFNPLIEIDHYRSTHTIIEISSDDIPFLVDSSRMVINRYGLQIHFILHFGGLKVRRDNNHRIIEILEPGKIDKHITSEAPIYYEIDRIADEHLMQDLQKDIERVLGDVRVSVEDWNKMVARVEDCLRELEKTTPHLDLSDVSESRDFLRWLINNNFTFLGARDYKLIGDGTNRALQAIPGTGLGVLRDELASITSKSYADLPPQARKMALSKNILIIAKTNTTSTVHRLAYTDYIGVKKFSADGELVGESRFIGLYTSTAYHSSPRQIPFLRNKVDKVLLSLGFPPNSHDGKEAVHILETLPRDDLFQANQEELKDLTLSIIQLKERKRLRLLVRRDAFYRYFSCLVYVPREIFTTSLANAMQDILMHAFKGLESAFTIYFSDSVLARIHFLIRVNPKTSIDYNIQKIEKSLVAITRSWRDDFKDQLTARYGESIGLIYFNKYNKAFPTSYTEYYTPHAALEDISKIEGLSTEKPLGMLFFKTNDEMLSLKLFNKEQTIVLSDVLPILENMGLRVISERPQELKFKDGRHIWINDFDMNYVENRDFDIKNIKDNFQEAFSRIWFREAENDKFNRLVLEANLTWRETAMLRAYTKYLKQTGFTYSQQYIEETLIKNAEITKALVQVFSLRFDPTRKTIKRADLNALIHYIEESLESVTILDEDRILRRFLEIIQATQRTNYFQKSEYGFLKNYISYKFDPTLISDLPKPRPKYEIFVYSPRVEGIHLRAGKVARGGLRWSDRREDFRTEVLGLMKAQQVKNTLIVPEGAKGGFVVKQAMTAEVSRDDYIKEGINCYSTFISGLLDITDNIKDSAVVPPDEVVRYDSDDPYLVVAADKGTASFSDIANNIAKCYGFWLDDAFASGGSAGYDHKKMGITSRGVWVSVKRHFRELGIDPEKDNFTVVGIGDMSGDVFGNGMLLSKHIKLIGAFNHQHIFLDPDPDPEQSHAERNRLFNLPRSTWMDYNESLISRGGGVFSRSAKAIKLTSEIKHILNTKKEAMVPNELIKAMLKAPVDLIWNGGIGTFVKSSMELNSDVGDRTNDNIRLDATELNARVIAEGGNLGLTQLARIEYSLQGGIVNPDFIDNSAGVDTSDHEVNIKILLNRLMVEKKLTLEQRNKLLEKMADEVARLVLMDNYDQTLMLSIETSISQQNMDLFRQYINDLERQGRLDRKLEYLPDDKVMVERKANNKPLTRPEIAILLAYCKMYLKQDILHSSIPENAYFEKFLKTAFPSLLSEKYFNEMNKHSLRREIIATQLSKSITDRMGVGFVERLQQETGASVAEAICAFVAAENIYDMDKLWGEINALDNEVDIQVQYRMMLQIFYLIRRATRWLLRNRKKGIDINTLVKEYKPAILELTNHLHRYLDNSDKDAYDLAVHYLLEQKVPEKLAKHISAYNMLYTSLDIVEASKKDKLKLADVAKTYFLIGNRLELNWLRETMNMYIVQNQWDELARSGFRDDLDRVQRKLASKVLTMKVKEIAAHEGTSTKIETASDRVNYWLDRNQALLDRWAKLITSIKASDTASFIAYSVALRELFGFVQVV